jgi:hypothetical protein
MAKYNHKSGCLLYGIRSRSVPIKQFNLVVEVEIVEGSFVIIPIVGCPDTSYMFILMASANALVI